MKSLSKRLSWTGKRKSPSPQKPTLDIHKLNQGFDEQEESDMPPAVAPAVVLSPAKDAKLMWGDSMPENHDAATKLQARYRGRRSRKSLKLGAIAEVSLGTSGSSSSIPEVPVTPSKSKTDDADVDEIALQISADAKKRADAKMSPAGSAAPTLPELLEAQHVAVPPPSTSPGSRKEHRGSCATLEVLLGCCGSPRGLQ